MPARLVSDNRQHVVIRPLAYVSEDEARLYAQERELPVVGCCCPVCGDFSLQRQRIKRLLMDLERDHPDIRASMLKALGNVMPRHLLDRRLQTAAAEQPAESAAQLALDEDPPAAGSAPVRIIPLTARS
jgi:tRNA 2-thiocytidine biosynthesis protein TtcA